MTPIERFQALLDGKKIRLTHWEAHEYFWLKHGDLVNEIGTNIPHIDALTLSFNEWELYEEPKPVIKLTFEDVGKVVKRDDNIFGVILEFDPVSKRFSTLGHWFDEYGNGLLGHCRQIVEVYR